MERMTTAGELAKREFPPLLQMLGAWLTQPSLGMVYGWRGSGKTWFALSVAYTVAAGGKFIKWFAKAPSKVVYIDGEMGKRALKTRQEAIVRSAENDLKSENLCYATFEDFGGVIPNLADPGNWPTYDHLIREKHLCIIDNICTCVRPTGKQSDADAWAVVQQWAVKKRSEGVSVLFVHHSGKSGTQLGTSTREIVMDYVIALRRPQRIEAAKGCVFELHFEKNRHFWGPDAEALYVELIERCDGLHWKWAGLHEAVKLEVLKFYEDGYRPGEIADLLGVNTGLVRSIVSQVVSRPERNRENDIF